MSLYNRMLNTNTVTVNEAAYGHEEGSFAIAMESAQELYQIFRESTFEAEQEELKALNEGVVLEGSQYEVVKENAIKKGFNKIVEYLKKLWAKVKAFFANVVKFLDGIFKSGKEFATKYEKDLLALGNKLDGFEYKMYKYDNAQIDNPVPNIADMGAALITAADKSINRATTKKDGSKVSVLTVNSDSSKSEVIKDAKDAIDEEVKKHRKSLCDVVDADDQSEAMFKLFRNGAVNESDKEDIKVDIRSIIKILKDSKADAYNTLQGKLDSAYKKVIKYVEDKAKVAEKLDGVANSAYAEILRAISSGINEQQNITNALVNAGKTAFTERSNTYKQVCIAAFRYKKDK